MKKDMKYFRENIKKYYVYQSSKLFGFPFMTELHSKERYLLIIYAYSFKHALKRFRKKYNNEKPKESSWEWAKLAIREEGSDRIGFYS